jgi:DNA-binding CsgD family transcriptional regulator
MAEQRHSGGWYNFDASVVADVIRDIGTPELFPQVMRMLAGACGARSGGAMVFHRSHAPHRLFHWVDLTTRSVPEDAYLNGPYVLDPHYRLFLDGCPSGCYWLQEIAPDNFRESDYFKAFYSRIGVCDSMDVLWRIDEDSALSFFIERGHEQGLFEPADVAAVSALLPIVDAACRRHQEHSAWEGRDHGRDLTHLKLECALEHFGKSVLSRREHQVLVLTLRGYSAAMAGEKLFTSEGTVKIHRKNIHRKLDIGSQAELFALFVRCIPYADPHSATDPLLAYESRPSTDRAVQAAMLQPSSGLTAMATASPPAPPKPRP